MAKNQSFPPKWYMEKPQGNNCVNKHVLRPNSWEPILESFLEVESGSLADVLALNKKEKLIHHSSLIFVSIYSRENAVLFFFFSVLNGTCSGVQACSITWWVATILTTHQKVGEKFSAYWNYTGYCKGQCRKVPLSDKRWALPAVIYRVFLKIRCDPVFENTLLHSV